METDGEKRKTPGVCICIFGFLLFISFNIQGKTQQAINPPRTGPAVIQKSPGTTESEVPICRPSRHLFIMPQELSRP